MTDFSTWSLVDVLLSRAKQNPEHGVIHFIGNDGSERTVTSDEILEGTLAFSKMIAGYASVGDPVIIALPHGMEIIYAFFGALYVGAVPSIFPFSMPRPSEEVFMGHILKIVRNAEARVVVAGAEYSGCASLALRDLRCKFVAVDDSIAAEGDRRQLGCWSRPSSGSQLAYLQYTSGTTGALKGVALSHEAVLNFITAFGEAIDVRADDVMVNWSPLYHDGGLFFGMLMPMFHNLPIVWMSPFKWVRNPGFFLRTIHKHRGTLSWMPNSGFSHTALRTREQDLDNLDLTSLRFILNGSEPILHRTRVEFLNRFSRCGFRATALGTGYGLAENTLGVTVSIPDRDVPVRWVKARELHERRSVIATAPESVGSVSFVSSGRVIASTELRIVDEKGHVLPDGRVGEVAIRGISLFSGYYRQQELTRKCMLDGWLLTGDIGFLEDGWLYVCGRKKDIIIVGARNIYPEDIESLAATVEVINPDRIAVFGVLDETRGTERIILVGDLKRGGDETQSKSAEKVLRQLVYREMELTLDEIHLFKKPWLVKTANGKISRVANRDKYLLEKKRTE